jgi:regulator of replication initiation timing
MGGTDTEPIEAAYRVAGGAAAEVALVPLATMVEELRGLADQLAELARRNESLALEVGTLRERQAGQEMQIAARDQTISTQAEAMASQAAVIAELRRRAETAEAERDRLAAAQAAPDAPGATETLTPDNPHLGPAAGLWARVRRVFGDGV